MVRCQRKVKLFLCIALQYGPLVKLVKTSASQAGSSGSSPERTTICLYGGTGIHIRFKIGCRKDSGFKSLYRHQTAIHTNMRK